MRIHALLIQEPHDLLTPLPASRVLAPGRVARQVGWEPNGRKDLFLLRSQVAGRKGNRLLHRG